jgi:hypothetical protein
MRWDAIPIVSRSVTIGIVTHAIMEDRSCADEDPWDRSMPKS